MSLTYLRRLPVFFSTFVLGLAVLSFHPSAMASLACLDMATTYPGAWEFNNHTLSFVKGESVVVLDESPHPIESCVVNSYISTFLVDREVVTIRHNRRKDMQEIFFNWRFHEMRPVEMEVSQAESKPKSELAGEPETFNHDNNYYAAPTAKYPDEYWTFSQPKIKSTFARLAYAVHPELKIETRDCGVINAFYTHGTKTITLCYEYIDAGNRVIEQQYGHLPVNVQANMKTGVMMLVMLHEIGHAVIDLKHLVVMGGEEDASDRLAYAQLYQISKGSPERLRSLHNMVYGNLAFSWSLKPDAISKLLGGQVRYMDEHPVTEQRYYNLVCLAYGSDNQLFDDLRRQSRLSDSRAIRCAKEFEQAEAAARLAFSPKLSNLY